MKQLLLRLLRRLEDGSHENTETPQRIAKMYQESLLGWAETAEKHLAKSFGIIDNNMVVGERIFSFIPCVSITSCHLQESSHHVPNGPGSLEACQSWLERVEVYAKKCADSRAIDRRSCAEALMDYLGAQEAWWVEVRHMCMNPAAESSLALQRLLQQRVAFSDG